jgi:hypothetical protein
MKEIQDRKKECESDEGRKEVIFTGFKRVFSIRVV